ncbi:MAG: hypothetical protein R2713_20510 [Ilumatobacteraceae bacterium]
MPLALLSVYDKTGIVELAAALHELGWSIVSSGGTATAITAAGLPATDLADLTGVPAILDHRVVTLHPKVHGGLLADPTKPAHQADMAEYGISPIDLLVVNLYPFSSNPSIELIDIGGPAMVRAAAKNHHHVAVVVNPADYRPVVDEVRDHGAITPATRRRLARERIRDDHGVRRPDRQLVRCERRPPGRRCRRPVARPGCSCRSPAGRCCATARTRTNRAPGTSSTAGAAGGTTWCSTVARN